MSRVTTPTFRASFPSLFTPQSFEGGAAKYGITMLFDKGTDLSKLKKIAQEAVEKKWPDVSRRPKNLKNPFRDGDTEKAGIAGYEGKIFVKATSKTAPRVVDKKIQPLEETEFYAGCYAIASVTAYAYDFQGNRGVAFGLVNVQKVKDGEPFSSSFAKPEDDFSEIADDFESASTDGDNMFS